MNEELAQLDADLKGLFSENKIDEIGELLDQQTDAVVKELSDYYWNVIKKYYENEQYDLLFAHFKFVAFSFYVVEYAHRRMIISEEAYHIMVLVYNDIYELKKQQ